MVDTAMKEFWFVPMKSELVEVHKDNLNVAFTDWMRSFEVHGGLGTGRSE